MVRVSAFSLIVQVLGIGLEGRQVIRDEDLAFAEVGGRPIHHTPLYYTYGLPRSWDEN